MICIELKDGDLIRIPENKKLRLHKSVFDDIIRFELYDEPDKSEEFYLIKEYLKGEKYLAYDENGNRTSIDYITAANNDFEYLKNKIFENVDGNIVIKQRYFYDLWE